MALIFTSIDSPRPLRHSRTLKAWIKSAVEAENRQLGDVAIAFCSDSYMVAQNIAYLDHHYQTDILTFGYNEGKIVSGDLLISTDTVESNAKIYNVTFRRELHRVIIHGILHLIGYDDTDDKLSARMRAGEDHYLAELDKMMTK